MDVTLSIFCPYSECVEQAAAAQVEQTPVIIKYESRNTLTQRLAAFILGPEGVMSLPHTHTHMTHISLSPNTSLVSFV